MRVILALNGLKVAFSEVFIASLVPKIFPDFVFELPLGLSL